MPLLNEIDIVELLSTPGDESKQLGARTAKQHRSSWATFSAFHPSKTLGDIAHIDVIEYLQFKATPSSETGGRPRTGAFSFLERTAATLIRAFEGAERLELIKVSPLTGCTSRQLTGSLERRAGDTKPALPTVKVERLRVAASRRPMRSDWKRIRNGAILAVLSELGAKPRELLQLKRPDALVWPDGAVLLKIGDGAKRRRLEIRSAQAKADFCAWLETHDALEMPAEALFPANRTKQGTAARLRYVSLHNMLRQASTHSSDVGGADREACTPMTLRNAALARDLGNGIAADHLRKKYGFADFQQISKLVAAASKC